MVMVMVMVMVMIDDVAWLSIACAALPCPALPLSEFPLERTDRPTDRPTGPFLSAALRGPELRLKNNTSAPEDAAKMTMMKMKMMTMMMMMMVAGPALGAVPTSFASGGPLPYSATNGWDDCCLDYGKRGRERETVVSRHTHPSPISLSPQTLTPPLTCASPPPSSPEPSCARSLSSPPSARPDRLPPTFASHGHQARAMATGCSLLSRNRQRHRRPSQPLAASRHLFQPHRRHFQELMMSRPLFHPRLHRRRFQEPMTTRPLFHLRLHRRRFQAQVTSRPLSHPHLQ